MSRLAMFLFKLEAIDEEILAEYEEAINKRWGY